MSKLAIKLLLTSNILRRRQERIDWVWRITVASTLATIGLIGLYILQRG